MSKMGRFCSVGLAMGIALIACGLLYVVDRSGR